MIKVSHLTTIKHLSAEMRTIYRQTRKGDIELDFGKGLFFMLKIMVETQKVSDLETRLDELEGRTDNLSSLRKIS